jgi:hypothetical protein
MPTTPAFADPRPIEPTTRRVVPAWISSTVLHMALVLLLAITIKNVPRNPNTEATRTTGIVLKRVDNEGEFYEGEQDDAAAATESAGSESNATDTIAALPNANERPTDVSSFLPDVNEGLGPPAGEIAGGGNIDLGGAGPGNRNIEGGKARTGVFGLSGEGYNFVYVFDSSASMSSNSGRPLAAAKHELLASLQYLGRTHQFHIVFYNEHCRVFNPTGMTGKLFFATDENKLSAQRFVKSIEASLSTRHLPALLMAINMGPDVIFFLTDGEDPALSAAELQKVERRNAGRSTIHVIQFGTQQPTYNNWLKRLAAENSGQYKFFNIRRLSPRG